MKSILPLLAMGSSFVVACSSGVLDRSLGGGSTSNLPTDEDSATGSSMSSTSSSASSSSSTSSSGSGSGSGPMRSCAELLACCDGLEGQLKTSCTQGHTSSNGNATACNLYFSVYCD